MPTITEVKPLDQHRLRLRFEDGAEGEVDVSDLAGRGVFKAWDQPGAFEDVSIGTGGELVWKCGVDLCADMLYMRMSGKSPEEVFPRLRAADTRA